MLIHIFQSDRDISKISVKEAKVEKLNRFRREARLVMRDKITLPHLKWGHTLRGLNHEPQILSRHKTAFCGSGNPQNIWIFDKNVIILRFESNIQDLFLLKFEQGGNIRLYLVLRKARSKYIRNPSASPQLPPGSGGFGLNHIRYSSPENVRLHTVHG